MQIWEYKTIKVRATGFFSGGNIDAAAFDYQLNQLGAEGWELAASFDTNETYGKTRDAIAIFKRPKKTPPPLG